MKKTRNMKSDIWSEKEDIKLKSIMKEISSFQNKQINKIKKYASINERALNGILNSGVLTIQESAILRHYFKTRNIRRINENTVRKINEDSKLISEGFFDFFKKFGDKAKEAFKTGWTAVKAIWKNFSDVVKEFIEEIKKGFVKISDWALGKIKEMASKLSSLVNEKFIKKFKEDHPHDHTDLKTELQQTKQTADHLTKWVKTNILDGGMYEQKLIDGSVDPKEETEGLPAAEVEKGAEELKKEAYELYDSIFSNKQNLRELMNLSEGHLTDKIKNPIVRNVVKFLIYMFKAVFSPLSTVIAEVGRLIIKNFMKMFSKLSKALQGPGVFEFAIMSLLCAELFEVVEDLLANLFNFQNVLGLVTTLLPWLAPWLEFIHVPMHLAHLAIGSYALATVVYNVGTVFGKFSGEGGGEGHGEEHGGEEHGGEAGAENAGYTPKGQFRLSEGKLIFVR